METQWSQSLSGDDNKSEYRDYPYVINIQRVAARTWRVIIRRRGDNGWETVQTGAIAAVALSDAQQKALKRYQKMSKR